MLLAAQIYQPATAFAQGTAFTRQGRIRDGTTKTVFVNSPTGNHYYRLFKP